MFGPLLKQYDGIDLHVPPMPGDVQFVYHTYYGFLVFAIQSEHRVSCPPDQALVLLGRFLRFNLTLGMFAYGVLVMPLLAYGNYLVQKQSIKKQIRRQRLGGGPQPQPSFRPVDPDNPYAAPRADGRE